MLLDVVSWNFCCTMPPVCKNSCGHCSIRLPPFLHILNGLWVLSTSWLHACTDSCGILWQNAENGSELTRHEVFNGISVVPDFLCVITAVATARKSRLLFHSSWMTYENWTIDKFMLTCMQRWSHCSPKNLRKNAETVKVMSRHDETYEAGST